MTDQFAFSIIIPTYNRPERLARCLAAIAALNFPTENFEVVIVDDGSPNPLKAADIAAGHRLHLSFYRQPNAGPASARNTGARAAQGRWLAFIDDDCTPHPDWLTALAAGFEANGTVALGGRILNGLDDNAYSTASQVLLDYLYGYFAQGNAGGGARPFFASCNFAMPRTLFEEIGGFDTRFPIAAGEDREICDRLARQGHNLVYAPDATIHHWHHLSLAGFFRQHRNYGAGAVEYHRRREADGADRPRMEPMAFYRGLLGAPFGREDVRRPLRVSLLLALSQFAMVYGYAARTLSGPSKRARQTGEAPAAAQLSFRSAPEA